MSDTPIFSMNSIERNPRGLLRLLALLGVISMLLILFLTGYGIYRQSMQDVLLAAEDDAKRITSVMLDEQKYLLFSADEQKNVLNKQEIAMLNKLIRKFLHPFGIVKIKVFKPNRLIIFSTDGNIIGEQDTENPRLEKALHGEIDTHLENKDTMVDLADEQLFDVDVVETYLPFFNDTGKVIGSIELYVDVTRYRIETQRRVTHSVLILGIILLLIFSISYAIVYIGAQHLKQLFMQLQTMAVSDPLTGIYNRGALINRAEEELSRLKRGKVLPPGNGLGVIMIDLDYFKKVNDTYGHQTGDEVLCEMTIRVANCLREYDIFGRYGGEEFLVFVPNSDLSGTKATAERIRNELIKSPFSCGDHTLPITASFGVTCCQESTKTINVILQRADEALYKAKEDGRNRVVGLT